MDFEEELSRGIRCEEPKDLALAAERLALVLPLNLTLSLMGPMGAGKTFIASHLAKALGVKETLKSPTYDIVSAYHSSARNIVHLDAFRIETTNDLELLGLEELLVLPWLLLVEWPERIPATSRAGRPGHPPHRNVLPSLRPGTDHGNNTHRSRSGLFC